MGNGWHCNGGADQGYCEYGGLCECQCAYCRKERGDLDWDVPCCVDCYKTQAECRCHPRKQVSRRRFQPGWTAIGGLDAVGRRGVWIRTSMGSVEFCAGREGDGEYLRLQPGQVIGPAEIAAFRDIELSTIWNTGPENCPPDIVLPRLWFGSAGLALWMRFGEYVVDALWGDGGGAGRSA